ERVLNPPQVIFDGQATYRRVLLVGALPPGMPDSLPMPPGQIVGSIASYSSDGLSEVSALLDVPGEPSDVRARYAEDAQQRGWHPSPPGAFSGGFRSAPSGPGGIYCQDDGPSSIQIGVDDGSASGSEVWLTV